MSLTRATLVVIQATANGWVCSPPNPTSQKHRYHTEQMYILQIAPLIFKIHQVVAYLFATFEVFYYLRAVIPPILPSFLLPSSYSTSPFALSVLSTAICPSTSPYSSGHIFTLTTTPTFLLGVLAVILGCYIRLDCFATLGPLFTFDLTIHPNHTLVTRRFYAYVRHPAYTGSMLLVIGLALSHLTQGSWATECGPLSKSWGGDQWGRVGRMITWVGWWAWTFCVGISRADAEDKQMRKMFKQEWEAYAREVQWWFLPGLI